MKFYWAARTRSSRVAWMLEELGIDYDLVTVPLGDPSRFDIEGFRQASPMGKVPAIADGDVALADSTAICLYLADRHSLGTLAPAIESPLRGRYYYWMTYTPGVIEPAMAEKAGGWKAKPQHHGWGDFPMMIETLERGLGEQPWLLGDEFSAADVNVGAAVVFLRLFNMLGESEVLDAYADRCLARPAYQRALAMEKPND